MIKNRVFYILVMVITFGCLTATVVAGGPPELSKSLSLGSKGEDVKKLQEFLAQDKEIYPEGLVTGYFGMLTQAAVKKWQAKNDIEAVGIVGPKTRAKFNELRQLIEAVPTPIVAPPIEQPASSAGEPALPVSEPASSAGEPVPAPQPEPVKPASAIKTGTGLAVNFKNFKIGPADFFYAGQNSAEKRGYLYPGETSNEVANITSAGYSSCEEIAISGYDGINDICQFIDPAKYKFSGHKEAIRLYDKNAAKSTGYRLFSCYQKILLFKEGNIYGAIDPEKIDAEGLHYRYWYDESGGSNFAGLCQQSNIATINKLASVMESLRSVLENLKKSLR